MLAEIKYRKSQIITSVHADEGINKPILHSRLEFAPVTIENDCDIGAGVIVLPGVTIAQGTQVGAGAVVNKDLPPYAVAAGVPARVIRIRP
jgi:acetyltransferase-like isoleucine patch superfamily enzyme